MDPPSDVDPSGNINPRVRSSSSSVLVASLKTLFGAQTNLPPRSDIESQTTNVDAPRRSPTASPNNIFSQLLTFLCCCFGVSTPAGGGGGGGHVLIDLRTLLPAPTTHDDDEHVPTNNYSRLNGSDSNTPRDPLLAGGGDGGAPPRADDDDAWAKFLDDSNTFIQWSIPTLLVFIPARVMFSLAQLLVAILSPSPAFSTEFLLAELEKKVLLPLIFLPLLVAYGGFFICARFFKNKTLKFTFEVFSLVTGFLSVSVVFYFLADAFVYTSATLLVFLVVLGVCKGCDK